MAWSYSITSGALLDPSGILIGHGYSGRGEGLNNSSMTNVPDVGPIPVGHYTIGSPFDSDKVGKFALPLTPDPTNIMFGRSLFRIHGDNPELNHTASEGCIILARDIREKIAKSLDKILAVNIYDNPVLREE